ncbi:MAG: hypothetical protein JNK42_00555 [Caedimonas sp.]|nr:hypothetical protein [Caedimonas sp.]
MTNLHLSHFHSTFKTKSLKPSIADASEFGSLLSSLAACVDKEDQRQGGSNV